MGMMIVIRTGTVGGQQYCGSEVITVHFHISSHTHNRQFILSTEFELCMYPVTGQCPFQPLNCHRISTRNTEPVQRFNPF